MFLIYISIDIFFRGNECAYERILNSNYLLHKIFNFDEGNLKYQANDCYLN